MAGRPLIHPSELESDFAVNQSLKALLYGDDECPTRSTRARGWSKDTDSEELGRVATMTPFEWLRELEEIDDMISEEITVNPTPLPTANLLEKIDDMTDKLSTWFSNPLPRFHARKLRHSFDEMAEIGSLLRSGVINAGEAQQRFNTVMSEVSEIVDYSNFEV